MSACWLHWPLATSWTTLQGTGTVFTGALNSTAPGKDKVWRAAPPGHCRGGRVTARAEAGLAPGGLPAGPSAGSPAAVPLWLHPGSQSPPRWQGQGCTHLHNKQAGNVAAACQQRFAGQGGAGQQGNTHAFPPHVKPARQPAAPPAPHAPSRGLAAVLWNSRSRASRSLPASARSDRRLGGPRRVRPRNRSRSFSRSNTSRLR